MGGSVWELQLLDTEPVFSGYLATVIPIPSYPTQTSKKANRYKTQNNAQGISNSTNQSKAVIIHR